MTWSKNFSARVRVVAPIAGIGSVFVQRIPVLAQDEGRAADEPATPVPNRDAFSSLLSLVPAPILNTPDLPLWLSFGDMAAQLAAGGIEPPTSIEDDEGLTRWISASYPIAIAEPFRSNALTLGRDLLGFDVTDIDQSLEAGSPPHVRTLLRGRFDREAVAAAWSAHDYQLSEIDGVTVATLFEDTQIDLSHEISRIALTRMNNAAFLPDGTLAYTPSLDTMKEMIAVANGDAPSVGEDDGIVTLLKSLPTPLASAIFFDGEELSIASQLPVNLNEEVAAELMATLEELDPIPPIALGLVGITPGGPTRPGNDGGAPPVVLPDATIVYRLLMSESGSADAAVDVVLERLESMSSVITRELFSDIYELREVSSIFDGAVLGVDLRPADGRSIALWTSGLFARDLLFLAW